MDRKELMDRSELIKYIAGNARGSHISLMTESDIANVGDVIKTPALDLNRILSGNLYKGIPSRNLVGIVGKYGTFKSSFSALCMAEAINHGYQPIIIDTEGAMSSDFCARWGLDVSKTIYISETYVERVMAILAQLKESGQEKMIITIDSIGGLDRYKAFKDALDDDAKLDQGQLQRNIKQMLKLLLNICIHQNSIGIITAHYYAKPGAYVTTDEVAGGESVKYVPSILISLKRVSLKGEEKQESSEITATTIKNRMYPPFQTATIRVDYTSGIQQYAGLLDLAIKAGIVTVSGNTHKFGEVSLGVGAGRAEENLGKHPEILTKLNDWLKTTGYSSRATNIDPMLLTGQSIEEAEETTPEEKEIKLALKPTKARKAKSLKRK